MATFEEMSRDASHQMSGQLFKGERLILVGTYSQDLGFVKGEGAGVYAFRLTGTGTFGAAVFLNKPLLGTDAVGANPTYLCASPAHKGVVYVANEEDRANSTVAAARVTLDAGGAPVAQLLGESLKAGDSSTCHVAATATQLFCANYSGGEPGCGSAAAFSIDARGGLAKREALAPLPPADDGPDKLFPRANLPANPQDFDHLKGRQTKAHAHMALLSGDQQSLLVPDLGSDAVWRLRASDLEPLGAVAVCAPGDGPRHAAWHPKLDILYVLCELSCRLLAFRVNRHMGFGVEGHADSATLDAAPFASARTLPRPCYPGDSGYPTRPPASCAALVVHPSGNFCYCSNRAVGVDGLITKLPIDEDGVPYDEDAVYLNSCGRTPREIAFAGPNAELLLVANQDTNTILSFACDPETGALTKRHQVTCKTPVCLLDLDLSS